MPSHVQDQGHKLLGQGVVRVGQVSQSRVLSGVLWRTAGLWLGYYQGRCCPGCCPRVLLRMLYFWPRVWCYFAARAGLLQHAKINDVPKGSAALVEDEASWVSRFASLQRIEGTVASCWRT